MSESIAELAQLRELISKILEDPRLVQIRNLAKQYDKLRLRSIPRKHNQRANLLARNGGITGESAIDASH